MLAQLIREVRATLLNPRAYAREVMFPRGYSPREILTIGGLAATLYAVVIVLLHQALVSVDDPEFGLEALAQISSADAALSAILNGAVSLAVTWIGAWKIGEMAGGTGGPKAVAAAVVWHFLCTLVAIPVFLVVGGVGMALSAATGISLFVLIALFGVLIYSLWLQASLIGEAHGFPNTKLVAIFLLGGNAVVLLISNTLLS